MILSSTPEYTPAEQPLATTVARNVTTIGLPLCMSKSERRFPLTPEAAKILTDSGYTIRMEAGAGRDIHYPDGRYTRAGVEICSRAEVLRSDIVINLSPLSATDIHTMRRGGMLLTFLHSIVKEPACVRELMRMNLTTIAIDLIEDENGNTPFADILDEIDGRAAMAIASSLLADSVHGKGILLGGIAGIVPCETLIIGSNDTACSAARTAVGMGAIVRMMDNDVYRLRAATRELGPGVIGSALHPRTLEKALSTADVVVYTDITSDLHFDLNDVDTMKRGVITFDLSSRHGKAFPSMREVNLAESSALDNSITEGSRVCYINAGSAVPRTAAMALSNTFITLFDDTHRAGTPLNALKLLPGLQKGALTFLGRAVNRDVAEAADVKYSNLSLYLTLS